MKTPKEKQADRLFDLVLKKQKEVDRLLDRLYGLDEQSGMECAELLREGEY